MLLLVACGGGDSTNEGQEGGEATGTATEMTEGESPADAGGESAEGEVPESVRGNGRELVMFTITESNIYGANQIEGARTEAERLGYELTVFQNNFSQPEQDQQVQQYLASGAEPAAIIFWPWVREAATNSIRQLSQVAPVIGLTQPPNEEQAEFVSAYSGANQNLIGRVTGEMLLGAREAAREAGYEFNHPDGNLFVFQHPEGEFTGVERRVGVEEVTADEPFNWMGLEHGANSPETGFEIGSQVVPRIQDEVDFLWISNQQAANGVIRALKDNGVTPGEDVWIVSGDCSGTLEAVNNGETYGTGIQPAFVEGRLAVRTAARYVANGGTQGETEQLEVTEEVPPVPETAPADFTYMPHAPAVGPEGVDETVIWGRSAEEICAGS